MLYKTEWHEAGNRLYNTGHIEKVRIPLHIWFMEQLVRRHPHWDWLDNLSKGWGNPLCAAYCFAWSNWYFKHEIRDYFVEVSFDKLSEEYRAWYEKDIG